MRLNSLPRALGEIPEAQRVSAISRCDYQTEKYDGGTDSYPWFSWTLSTQRSFVFKSLALLQNEKGAMDSTFGMRHQWLSLMNPVRYRIEGKGFRKTRPLIVHILTWIGTWHFSGDLAQSNWRFEEGPGRKDLGTWKLDTTQCVWTPEALHWEAREKQRSFYNYQKREVGGNRGPWHRAEVPYILKYIWNVKWMNVSHTLPFCWRFILAIPQPSQSAAS